MIPTRRAFLASLPCAIAIAAPLSQTAATAETPATAPKPTAPLSGKWGLTWFDEFTGNALDTSNWTAERGPVGVTGGAPYNPSIEQGWYSPEQVTVANGNLRLTASPSKVPAKSGNLPYTTGTVNASKSSTFRLRDKMYIEAKFRVNNANTMLWPAFWFLSDDAPKGGPDYNPEVDVMEGFYGGTRTYDWGSTAANVHWQSSTGSTSVWEVNGTRDGRHNYDPNLLHNNDWNTFGVELHKALAGRTGTTSGHTEITFYVNGTKAMTYVNTDDMLLDLHNLYPIFNLGIHKPTSDGKVKNFTTTEVMEIDYIRAWTQDTNDVPWSGDGSSTTPVPPTTPDTSDPWVDTDKDGIRNGLEPKYGTDPAVADTDKDGINDGLEVFTYKTNPLKTDTDGDGFTDYDEIFVRHTNPTKK